MAQLLDTNDMLFHALIVGGTGSGKTNCILYMLDLLFNKKEERALPPSLFFFDPAGDASIDLVRAIPRSEQSRVVILDLGLPEDDLGKLIVQGDAPLPDASEGGDEKEPGSAEQRAANKGLGSNS